MVECLLGHRTFDALWCAPYDDLSKDPATFCEGIRSAVRHVRVKLKVALQGATFGECARKLAKGLLTIDLRHLGMDSPLGSREHSIEGR